MAANEIEKLRELLFAGKAVRVVIAADGSVYVEEAPPRAREYVAVHIDPASATIDFRVKPENMHLLFFIFMLAERARFNFREVYRILPMVDDAFAGSGISLTVTLVCTDY
jgi:hypothetical protein